MPEVIGEAAEYFDPGDTNSIASAIRNVVTSSKRRAELTDAGTQRLTNFSWDRCARETLEVYQQIV